MKKLSDGKNDCQLRLQALLKAVEYVGGTGEKISGIPTPDADQITAEMRDALCKLSDVLGDLLLEFTGPIYDLLPDDVIEACEKAGL